MFTIFGIIKCNRSNIDTYHLYKYKLTCVFNIEPVDRQANWKSNECHPSRTSCQLKLIHTRIDRVQPVVVVVVIFCCSISKWQCLCRRQSMFIYNLNAHISKTSSDTTCYTHVQILKYQLDRSRIDTYHLCNFIWPPPRCQWDLYMK